MADILKSITGLLQNPIVQGAGLAASGGFNPLLGLVAGPIIGNQRQRSELALEEARQRVERGRKADAAMADLQGLLTQKEDPVVGPSTMDVMGIDGQPIAEVPGRMVQQPTIQTPEGQQKALGLLMQTAPNIGMQGLLNQMGIGSPRQARQTELLDLASQMKMLGFDDDKIRSAIQNRVGGLGDEAFMNEMDMRLRMMELTTAERDARFEEQNRVRNVRRTRTSLNRTLSKVDELGKIQERLQGRFLESGGFALDWRLPMAELVRDVRAWWGDDTEAADQSISDLQLLQQGSSELLTLMNEAAETSNLAQFRVLAESKPTTEMTPEAAFSRYADIAELALQTAMDDPAIEEIGGVSNVEYYEEMIRRFTELSKGGSAPGTGEAGMRDRLRQEQQQMPVSTFDPETRTLRPR